MTTDSGPLPVGNGEPGTDASAPLVLFIRRTETLLDPLFAVTRKLPEGSVSAETGPVPPLAKGDPLTAVRAPVLPFTLYVEMVFSAVLDTNKNFPAGSSATDEGSEPVGKGEPVMGLRLPVPGLITKPITVFVPPAFVT